MNSPEVLALSRLIVGLAFAISFYRKAREFEEFEYSLEGFQIVKGRWIRPSAYAILAAEAVLVSAAILGGPLARLAFGQAILMLTVFSGAMLSVIVRQIENPCSCFGATDNLISGWDLLRNLGFVAWAAAGLVFAGSDAPPAWQWPLLAAAALGFVLLWIRLRDLVRRAGTLAAQRQRRGSGRQTSQPAPRR